MSRMVPGHSAPAAGFEVPLEMLSACHGRIEQQCSTLRRLQSHLLAHGADDQARVAAAAVMRYFDLAARQHHEDEERDLFPALLESMAAGVPVIATPVGAIPDVVSHDIHGFLVPPRDGKAIAEAIAILAGDREKLSWMSRACRRRVRAAFSIERLAQEFSYHYARLVGHVSLAGVGGARSTPARNSEPLRAPEKLED